MEKPRQENVAKDVDAYIAGFSAEARPTLEALRAVISAAVPEAEEGISWGVPFYRYHGLLGGFSGFRKHVNFGPWLDVIQGDVRETLEQKGYELGKRTVKIRFDQDVPAEEITQMLTAIAESNAAHAAAK